MNISFKTEMTILLMFLVDVELLFASLTMEFFFFFFGFVCLIDSSQSLCLSSLVVGPCFQKKKKW